MAANAVEDWSQPPVVSDGHGKPPMACSQALTPSSAPNQLQLPDGSQTGEMGTNALSPTWGTVWLQADDNETTGGVPTTIDLGKWVADEDATELHQAVATCDVSLVMRYLEQRVNSEPRTKLGCTPLHIACWNGHELLVSALVASGASVGVPDEQ